MRLNTVEFLSFGKDRIYAKEQALIDLVKDELANDRPCVVYLRQTATKDIQPRIEELIRQHVPGAVPYILKNTIQAERREKVIDDQIKAGVNVVICNPELVKTGLDLVHFPTLIFYEITFHLGTMMQASARSYRLNQTHLHCKTYYIFAVATMEHTAVQLMSRKQRAAKLLTGDIGLTGLEALTEGESGFEEALLDAIASDETLLDPSEMFKTSAEQSVIDGDDAAYWHVETIAEAVEETQPQYVVIQPEEGRIAPNSGRLSHYISGYLDSVHLIYDDAKRHQLQDELFAVLMDGTVSVIGFGHTDFMTSPAHAENLTRYVQDWLEQHRFVFAGCEGETALKIIDLAQQALGLTPLQLGLFQTAPSTPSPKRQTKRRKKLDLLTVPDDAPEATDHSPLVRKRQQEPVEVIQLALF